MESDLGLLRQYNRSIGLSDSGVELAEDYRLLRYWDVLLCAVVNVVHPYADQLLRTVDRCFQDKVSRGAVQRLLQFQLPCEGQWG